MTDSTPEPTLPKTFDPAAIEAKWYAHWETNGLFRPERPDAQPFTIVNPPPNVTGSLHIGHALDNTLQDVVVRYERLRGKDALWVVGTDHAGIATQMVVERQLEEAQDKRTNYTREAFIAKVWEWKAESGGTITQQLRRLGCSMDWSREQFTMDPHFTTAVVKVFVDLYNTVLPDGTRLIYRDKRLVNWDPKLKTAISDLEVETREVKGSFWRFRYPFADGSGHVEVATTRPETMLADMCVAVHPDDARYTGVIGKDILQPLTGRTFKVVADEHADPELGSGVVKITPGHDFNDFEVGKRAGIAPAEMLNMFDAEARVVKADSFVPDEFVGLDRFEARKLVVQRMKELGFLVPYTITREIQDGENVVEHWDAEPRTIQTPFGDRGGVEIEPWLTDQWYVNAEELAKAPLEAVRSGAVEIVPKSWEKTFFNWMENIQPWCVSRQLWWGHRIPAWFGPAKLDDGTLHSDVHRPDGEMIFVAETEQAALALAEKYYGNELPIRVSNTDHWSPVRRVIEATTERVILLDRDSDVLDTWFSSALWPFATLGWPEGPSPLQGRGLGEGAGDASAGAGLPHSPTLSPEGERETLLARHYPGDLLISGFDILFFWDARMLMMGQALTGKNPWPRLYLHGLVRAPDGQKMSKSKGNVVDPLGLIDQFGADALRFFMAAMESQGRDIKMDERRVEGYRNFATKLWNAARFCQSNGIAGGTKFDVETINEPVNKWIISTTTLVRSRMDIAMANLRFDDFANEIYHFVWSSFCDRYLEVIKAFLAREDGSREETIRVCGWVLDQILIMLHPLMPFITEEIWHSTAKRENELIIALITPTGSMPIAPDWGDAIWLFDFVDEARSMRAELGIAPSKRLDCYFKNFGGVTRLISAYRDVLERMTRIGAVFENVDLDTLEKATIDVEGSPFEFDLRGVIDIAAEKARLTKALEASTKEAKSLEARLANPAFAEKAKPEAVEKARADHAMHATEAERLAAALARLG